MHRTQYCPPFLSVEYHTGLTCSSPRVTYYFTGCLPARLISPTARIAQTHFDTNSNSCSVPHNFAFLIVLLLSFSFLLFREFLVLLFTASGMPHLPQ
jgi:hypothetical protein